MVQDVNKLTLKGVKENLESNCNYLNEFSKMFLGTTLKEVDNCLDKLNNLNQQDIVQQIKTIQQV